MIRGKNCAFVFVCQIKNPPVPSETEHMQRRSKVSDCVTYKMAARSVMAGGG